jgi:hypothetical protein
VAEKNIVLEEILDQKKDNFRHKKYSFNKKNVILIKNCNLGQKNVILAEKNNFDSKNFVTKKNVILVNKNLLEFWKQVCQKFFIYYNIFIPQGNGYIARQTLKGLLHEIAPDLSDKVIFFLIFNYFIYYFNK